MHGHTARSTPPVHAASDKLRAVQPEHPQVDDVRRALGGDRTAMRALIAHLRPAIHGEVAAALDRRRGLGRGRDVRQEVLDLVQEVFMALLNDDGRILRRWDPAAGCSLRGFVRMVSRHQVASIMRSGRRSPWSADPTEGAALERHVPAVDPRAALESRARLDVVLERLHARLDTRGWVLFERLYIDEAAADTVAAELGMTRDAVYAWRARFKRLVARLAREIDG